MAAWDVTQIDHRRLLRSNDLRFGERWMRAGLRGASLLYGVAARTRRYQYDRQWREIHHADVPVISVGNLTTGGTGKTPVVAEICRRLRDQNRRVAIVSRGYGATTGYNDEALELMRQLPEVPIVQDADRVTAARIAVDELEAEIIVMDDGFQHRRLHRDLDIVVVDATDPFGGGWMLPGGYLREPVSSLRRAGLVLITRTDQVDADAIASIHQTIARHHADVACVETMHRPAGFGRFQSDALESATSLSGRPVTLVSAIGNPDAFAATVGSLGCDIVGRLDLPDHDSLDRATRQHIRDHVESLSTRPERVICTAKDFVKLQTDAIAGVPVSYLQIDLAMQGSDEPLRRALASV